MTPSAVSKWKSTLEEDGIEGLESIPDEGNQGRDSQLVELLEEGAQAHGWETDLSTRKRVAALIEREFDHDFTPRHCLRILRERGYRPVKPTQEAAEKDPEAKRQWLHEEGDQLKKAD